MRYVALLRAVNVGGRVVKMDELKRLFARMKFDNVATFIASGNVVFESPQRSAAAIEQAIERRLADALGYEVTTFVRSLPEMQALVEHRHFADRTLEDGQKLYVAFTRGAPGREVERKLNAVPSPVDAFKIDGNHVFWWCRGPFHESKFSGPLLERTLGMRTTVRNGTTVRKIAEKFGAT